MNKLHNVQLKRIADAKLKYAKSFFLKKYFKKLKATLTDSRNKDRIALGFYVSKISRGLIKMLKDNA